MTSEYSPTCSGPPEEIRQYQFIPLEHGHIRLLRLFPSRPECDSFDTVECELFHVPLEGTHTYESLSYSWGSQRTDWRICVKPQSNTSERGTIAVTENLFTALRRLRLADTQRILWIDQLCIDQCNMVERSQQVQRMRRIYERSRRTIVWLGEQDEYTSSLENTLQ
jgi:hypothetical protein